MSDRIDEYHGDEAKVLTTDEVERWQEFLGDGIQLRRTLATTRALETAQVALRDEKARIDSIAATFDELGTGYLARAEKAERERDEARAMVAELVTALAGLERRFLDPRPGDPGGPCWCSEDRPRWMDHEDCCDVARGALAKAKGTK